MRRIRRYTIVVLPVAVILLIGLLAYAEIFYADYSRDTSYLGPGAIRAELLPSDSHIVGSISARKAFSVYVVESDSGYFEGIEDGKIVMSWENVTSVEMDFTSGDGYYLVIKNGNESQEIVVDFNAER